MTRKHTLPAWVTLLVAMGCGSSASPSSTVPESSGSTNSGSSSTGGTAGGGSVGSPAACDALAARCKLDAFHADVQGCLYSVKDAMCGSLADEYYRCWSDQSEEAACVYLAQGSARIKAPGACASRWDAYNTCLKEKPICTTDAECLGTVQYVCLVDAEPKNNRCVECKSNANCTGARPICTNATHTCEECAQDSDCKDTVNRYCGQYGPHLKCMGCTKNEHCSGGKTCQIGGVCT